MELKYPPISKSSVLSNEELVELLSPLVGKPFVLTKKPRTDGSALRKMITPILEKYTKGVATTECKVLPSKNKGIPKLFAQLVDTYLVTSGDSYNLQVWNRSPNSPSALALYNSGETISAQDIRYVMVKISLEENIIESIVVLTSQYIVDKFGMFGKPTIKSQLLISQKERDNIIQSDSKILFYDDSDNLKKNLSPTIKGLKNKSTDEPNKDSLLSLAYIKEHVASKLIGVSLETSDTKNRGQSLERKVISLLGYSEDSKLVGGYPDVPNQLLEVKVQDTQTVDLGKYTPQFEEVVNDKLNLTTYDVRYLIALTNPKTNVIEGVVLSNGESLGRKFTYVSDTSYKCQRSIPMCFFEKYKGQCVFNP
ncbi:hypothetical protein [Parabacteroides merdae]|uniref:hypothetical protein n=1 Tax=Parabacteroides merdae TaxID=46503 RepID=UPI003CFECB12